MAAQRVKRLKDMVELLERLPASPERDRMLSEVRSRMVDVDTGVTPRAMLPVREIVLASPRPPKRDVVRTAPVVERPRPEPAATSTTEMEQSLWMHERLSLEDAPLPNARANGSRAVQPWTLGLRG